MNNSRLLIDEYPLMVLPTLATQIGLNEAIVLQQFHYWINNPMNKNIRDGRRWTYDSIQNWQKKNFPFWSESTIKRAINSLKKQKLIIVTCYNKAGFDKTNWYTVDYDALNRMNQRLVQNDLTSGSNCTNGVGQNEPTNTRDLPETSTETYKDIMSSSKTEHDHTSAKAVIDYLNSKTDKHFKHTATNYRLIESRLKEFSVDDLKHVVDVKSSQWLKDSKMNKYLRPTTLFNASKFEGYLNEQIEPQQKGESYGGIEF